MGKCLRRLYCKLKKTHKATVVEVWENKNFDTLRCAVCDIVITEVN